MKDRVKLRIDRLHALGLRYNGQEYVDGDFNVHWTEISCDTNEEFDAKVAAIKKEQARRAAA